jgi:tetratricopeptide (TPR) repeat protein
MEMIRKRLHRSAAGALGLVVAAAAVATAGTPVEGTADERCLAELVAAYEALEVGEAQRALDHYRGALSLAVSDRLRFQALLGLGSSYAALGQFERAVEPLEQARDLSPRDADAWYTLGTVYAAVGRTDDAVAAFFETARISPAHAAALYDLCLLLSGQGRHADAAAACAAATRAEPDSVEAWVGLGVARYHLAEYEQAQVAFRRALDLNADHARARYGLGLALRYGGDIHGARQQYLALESIDAALAQRLYDQIFP